ncbi:GntR family transcriptional regulator [Streptomyces cinnamoneus]|uniref:GntR family transcriptional regulator n=1 Tax=Streptomyces cinnamoneus TaxID=53446 RepID=UPI001EFD35E4|nr:winged helix-turn-helix domain-containing protein [Streptomyces cinnamoneus]
MDATTVPRPLLKVSTKTPLVQGARLPGERDLAEEYGVAIGTARRAIQELRERGLLITLPAKGTFVAQRQPTDAE